MFTFLGVITIIVGVVLKFVKIIGAPPFFSDWNREKMLKIIGIGIALIIIDQSTILSKESKQYYILNKLTGERSAIMSPGIKLVYPFVTQVKEWDKYVEIKGIKVDKDGNVILNEKETVAYENIEGPIHGGVGVRFIDKVTANVYPSVRFEMPSSPDQFISIVEKYRTQENLVMNTLVPTVSEQLKNITFMFTADEYVSGGATIYRAEIEDVLKNGSYIFTKEPVRDTIFAEPVLSGDSSKIVNNKREIREIKVYEKNSKILKDGVALRKKHEVTENFILTAQVIIDDIVLDSGYENKLKEQMSIAANAVVENQKVIAAKSRQAAIIAEGERDKAQERVNQEKEQVSKLISIETQVKEEESKRQLAEINVQTEKLKAEATRISAEAEAFKNSKLVQAGLTPLEKAKIEKETAIEVAKELAKMKTPEIVIMGEGKGNDLTNSLIQAEMAKQILKK